MVNFVLFPDKHDGKSLRPRICCVSPCGDHDRRTELMVKDTFCNKQRQTETRRKAEQLAAMA